MKDVEAQEKRFPFPRDRRPLNSREIKPFGGKAFVWREGRVARFAITGNLLVHASNHLGAFSGGINHQKRYSSFH